MQMHYCWFPPLHNDFDVFPASLDSIQHVIID